MESTALIVALVSTIAFVLYSLVASIVDIGHHHGGACETGNSAGVLQFISIQSVLLAVMSYSWSWIYWQIEVSSFPIQLIATILSGTAMVSLYVFGMRYIRSLNSPDQLVAFVPTVGMVGEVYLTVPAGKGGMGQVTIIDPVHGDFQVSAFAHSDVAIEAGSSVVVTEVYPHQHVVVRPV